MATSAQTLCAFLTKNGVPAEAVAFMSKARGEGGFGLQSISDLASVFTQADYEADVYSLAGRPVIAYCTVGGRSYWYARKLVAGGIDAVNYRDGILGWCRAELPLETPDKQPTAAVHPYWPIFRVPDRYVVKTDRFNEKGK